MDTGVPVLQQHLNASAEMDRMWEEPRTYAERCEMSAGKTRCPRTATTAIVENNVLVARVCDLCVGAALYIVGHEDTRVVPLRVWNRSQRLATGEEKS